MSDVVLVHGTGHGAWCWRDLVPELAAFSHNVHAIDLPCHGRDHTPLCEATLDLYARSILDAIQNQAIVVGHSMGGFPITRAALIEPNKIKRLVYVCAYIPVPGLSLVDMRRAWPEQPLVGAFDVFEDGSFAFKDDLLQDRLYQDCPHILPFARAHLCREPAQPSMTAIDARPNVPSAYIRCINDQAIPPDYQAEMAKTCDQILEIGTGHSPFFADPKRLAYLLDKLATGNGVGDP